ncbi:MAG: ATP-binding protein, partial [Brevinematales bacterium]
MATTEKSRRQSFLRNLIEEKRTFVLFNAEEEPFSEEFVAELEKQKARYVVYDYRDENLFAPYAPWLQVVIAEFSKLSETSRRRVYREEKIYYVLEQLIESELQTGSPSRFEPLIEEEVFYEIEECIQGIKKLYLRLTVGEKPLVVFLRNLHLAPESSLKFLQFLSQERNLPFQIYGVFSLASLGSCQALSELVAFCQEKNEVFEVWEEETMPGDEEESSLEFSTKDPDSMLKLQYSFLMYNALRDAYQIGIQCLKRSERYGWDEGSQMLMAWQTGKAAAILKEYNEAAHYFNMAFVLMEKIQSPLADRVRLYRDMAFVFFMKDSISDALTFLQKVFHLPELEKEKKIYFEAFFLYFQIEDKNRKQQPRPWREIYEKIINLASELHYENHLALIYINPYGIYSEYASDVEKYNTLLLNEKGIALAKKLHNTYRLSHGYQIRGLIYAVMGQYDQVITWYRRSLVLKKRM